MTALEWLVLVGYVLAVFGACALVDLLENVRDSRPARGSRASGRRRAGQRSPAMRRRPRLFDPSERFE